jgi:hypothetical protein
MLRVQRYKKREKYKRKTKFFFAFPLEFLNAPKKMRKKTFPSSLSSVISHRDKHQHLMSLLIVGDFVI